MSTRSSQENWNLDVGAAWRASSGFVMRKSRPMAESKMGRPAIWGPRKKHSISFPMPLYEKLSREASAAGLSLSEFVVIGLADSHGVELPDVNRNQHELPISA